MVASKGLRIYTTLDLGIQNTAEATVQHQLHKKCPSFHLNIKLISGILEKRRSYS